MSNRLGISSAVVRVYFLSKLLLPLVREFPVGAFTQIFDSLLWEFPVGAFTQIFDSLLWEFPVGAFTQIFDSLLWEFPVGAFTQIFDSLTATIFACIFPYLSFDTIPGLLGRKI